MYKVGGCGCWDGEWMDAKTVCGAGESLRGDSEAGVDVTTDAGRREQATATVRSGAARVCQRHT